MSTVANLAQHRRVRALLSELGDLARRYPRAGERLHKHLTDNRPQTPMESLVAKRSKQITLRIPEALFDDAQALTGPIEESPESMLYGQITPAFVMRLAMLEGMKVLEASYLGSQAPSLNSTGRATGPSTFDIPTAQPATPAPKPSPAPITPSEASMTVTPAPEPSPTPEMTPTALEAPPSTFDISTTSPGKRLSPEERTVPMFPDEPEKPIKGTLTERMKAYRKREGIGQREAAKRAKVSQSTWCQTEKGGNPRSDSLAKIEALLLGRG